MDRMLENGLTTAFVFGHLLAVGIEKEFAAFNPTSLLFLRNVRHVELRASTEAVITVRREIVDARTRSIRLSTADGITEWMVIDQNGIALAFSRKADCIVSLDERDAVVHAFLPTLEPTGLAVKIHADISTDPSRTRVVFDDRTASGINDIASLIVALLDEVLTDNTLRDASGMVAALVPSSDPRMAAFQRRSFKTELFAAMRHHAKHRFGNVRCRPSWLNAVDFEMLCRAAGIRFVPRNLDGIEGLQALLRFLGAKETSFDELSPSLVESIVTLPGAAELASQLAQRYATNQIAVNQVSPSWRIWPMQGKVNSFDEAKISAMPLDLNFLDLLAEKGVASLDLRRLIMDISDAATAAAFLPQDAACARGEQTKAADAKISMATRDDVPLQHLSLKKWRSAEQQVLNLLDAQGWTVEDVSRQNIGYDIEGRTPEGEEAFIEVKAIDSPGQAFTLTGNEEAVARQRGAKYLLAIVRQTGNFLEVAFIRNPIQDLKLTRQCRQWVWECNEYTFTPHRFPLE